MEPAESDFYNHDSVRDERAMMRASLESLDEKYWSDEDEHAFGGAQPSSSSTDPRPPEDEDLEGVDDWSDLAKALNDPAAPELDSKAAEEYRSAIVCVLGHVDTGKTSLLDKLRKSSVQAGEAGGITQQMGATFFPREALLTQTAPVNHADLHLDIFLPGLLILDTPGHASFSAMRNRGSSLCDMAILVIDIMHGLERQTIESIQLLKKRKLPFVIALNKCDRIFQWKSEPNAPIVASMKKQGEPTIREFNQRLDAIMDELREHGVNPAPYFSNPDFRKHVSIVPISAMTGEGIADLLFLLIQLTQRFVKQSLHKTGNFRCHVLEVRTVEGVGGTASVILVEGTLKQGDPIIVAGLEGPILSRVRALYLPNAGREIRDQQNAQQNERLVKRVDGVMGVKLVGQGLEKCLAGSPVMTVSKRQSIDVVKAMVMEDVDALMKRVSMSNWGVVVHASTIGAMEALLDFLSEGGVPVRRVHIGKVTQATVAEAGMQTGGEAYRCVLAFDVKVTREAARASETRGVPIFSAPIIYHLFDAFNGFAHVHRHKTRLMRPFLLHVLPDFAVQVVGELEVGCDVGVLGRQHPIGYVQIMRRLADNIPIVRAKNGDEVTITLMPREGERHPKLFQSFDPYSDYLIPPVMHDSSNGEFNPDIYSPWSESIPYEWHQRAEIELPIQKIVGTIITKCKELNLEHEMRRQAHFHAERNGGAPRRDW